MLEAPFDLEDRKVSTSWVVSSSLGGEAGVDFQTEMFKAFCGWNGTDLQFESLECATASAIAPVSMDDFYRRDWKENLPARIAPELWHTKKAFVRGTDMGFSAWRAYEQPSNAFD